MNRHSESRDCAMAKNLKRFVNPRFTRTVEPELIARLLERHKHQLVGFDINRLRDDPERARAQLQDFFAHAEEDYPDGLVADLHRIAELGDATGLRLLLDQAARLGVVIPPERDPDGSERRQDPKHVALRVFLDHPQVFDAASDMSALVLRTSVAEYAGADGGVEAELNGRTKAAFEAAAATMLEADLMGRYCRVGWYSDAGEVNLVITHGSIVRTLPIVHEDEERVVSYRGAEHAVLSYAAATGRLKIGGVAKARRADLAELFATTMLDRPGFFAAPEARNLYTLAPVERAGCGFEFTHAFDPCISEVRIVEAQLTYLELDERSGSMRPMFSFISRDRSGNALRRLGRTMRGQPFGSDWHLAHIGIRITVSDGVSRPVSVTVKIRPPESASFKRHRFEARIMTLLRRNGLCRDRDADSASIAAE